MTALCALAIMAGCSNPTTTSTTTSEPTETRIPVSSDGYEAYIEAVQNKKDINSYTAAVNSMYKMKFSDDTYNVYTMDGVLEMDEDGTYHLTENFDSNGVPMNAEGYYYDGRLYNNYNDVTYYEDLTETELKQTLVTPLEPYSYSEAQLDSVEVYEDESGNTMYSLTLADNAATTVFSERYDIYGLSSYDDYKITKAVVEDTFDGEGHFLEENTTFDVSVTYSDQEILVYFTSSLNYTKLDSTTVELTKEQKKEQKTYVASDEIDTSSIQTETTDDDSAEKDALTTFKKRLIARLDYEENSDGTLSVDYNSHEGYTIDLNNGTFTYHSYSINYIYSWKGDIGSMTDCTYNFPKEKKTSGCTDENIEMLENVKQYLIMELYYCGLTLDDLVNNTQYK